MDPNAQNPQNQDQHAAQQDTVQQGVQQTPVRDQIVQQPAQPVSGGQKERAPLPSAASTTSEVVTPVETAPTLTPELKELGAEVSSESPNIPQEVANHIAPAKESVPVNAEPIVQVVPQLPMTQQQ